MNAWVAALAAALLCACGPSFDNPPEHPAHEIEEGGALHAARYEDPFSCGDPRGGDPEEGVPCPDVRPPDAQLSCDATGCHGGLDFGDPASREARHLFGSEGPSCYTCHGEEWKDD